MDRIEGFGCIATIVLILIVVVMVAWPILDANRNDSAARRDHAAAELTYARADASAQRQENWEHSFMMWTTALASFSNDPFLDMLTCLWCGAAIVLFAILASLAVRT